MVKLLKFSLTEKTMIEQIFMRPKMDRIVKFFPINGSSMPKIIGAINENQNIENNNLFTKPFHSILLNKIKPHMMPENGNISNIFYLPHILITYSL